ncbi:MAG: MBL fold metallo-hydrolase, partial [Thermodesulfobacteriota bacterium]|nr:MBL fold metallo-hydrolase [Thermodesulfobacteriota bacterium]
YILGEKEFAVIDPGPPDESHIQAILKAVNSPSQIRSILVSHTHPDHSPGAHLLKEKTGAEVIGQVQLSEGRFDHTYSPDRIIVHDEVFLGDNYSLRVIHTPGHASNHLCFFLEEEKIVFTGDHIMNGSTVVIAPPDGNMKAYIDSLELLKTYPIEKLAPGHGDMMDNPVSVIDGLIKHRLQREAKVIKALEKIQEGKIESLIPIVYDDVPEFLHPVAYFSLWAHLIKLEDEKIVAKIGDSWGFLRKK